MLDSPECHRLQMLSHVHDYFGIATDAQLAANHIAFDIVLLRVVPEQTVQVPRK